MNGLDQFESLAEQLVEGTFERLFRPRLHPSEVARRLARAMEDGRVVTDDGQALLPNQYWVFLNPDDFVALDAGGEALRAELIRYLERLAAERGDRFGERLRVALHPIAALEAGQLDVRAAHGTQPWGDNHNDTQAVKAAGILPRAGDMLPSDNHNDTQAVKAASQSAADASRWILRLGGRVFPLGEPVVRVGRALSNDLILADRRVSRRHAQLRWRAGSYHLSDMGSRGGTTVNGRSLRQGEELPLTGGDVISLAGINLTVQQETERSAVDSHPTPFMPSAEG